MKTRRDNKAPCECGRNIENIMLQKRLVSGDTRITAEMGLNLTLKQNPVLVMIGEIYA